MEAHRAKTPVHLWIIAALVLLLHGWGLFWGGRALLGGDFEKPVDYLWLIGLGAVVAGAVALLLRRRWAGPIFVLAIVAGAASLVVGFLPPADSSIGQMIVVMNGAMLLFGGGALYVYARAMARGGVLR